MTTETLVPKEFQPNPAFRDLTLFTSTFYGNDEASRLRQTLALELFERADAMGVPIVVTDGGSNQAFLTEVAKHPSVTLLPEPEDSTMGQSRRFALERALTDAAEDPNHIFMWLEPEKVNLGDPETLTKLVEPIREGKADVVVPSRIDKSTLPRQQAWLESKANHRATNLMKSKHPKQAIGPDERDLDLWFGPKVFNRRGAHYFANYHGKLDMWDSIIAPVLDAYRDGLEVADVPVDFTYPPSQTEQETDNTVFKGKRMFQYGKILFQLGDPFWRTHEIHDGKLVTIDPTAKQD